MSGLKYCVWHEIQRWGPLCTLAQFSSSHVQKKNKTKNPSPQHETHGMFDSLPARESNREVWEHHDVTLDAYVESVLVTLMRCKLELIFWGLWMTRRIHVSFLKNSGVSEFPNTLATQSVRLITLFRSPFLSLLKSSHTPFLLAQSRGGRYSGRHVPFALLNPALVC